MNHPSNRDESNFEKEKHLPESPFPIGQASTTEKQERPQSRDPQESLDLIVRELGRIQQNLARLENRLNVLDQEMTPEEAPEQTLTEIKERVTREAISSARERREIRKALADLTQQVEQLPQGHQATGRRPVEVPEQEQRVGIFVDVQNIFYAAKQFNARLDFEKLLQVAVGKRRLIRAIAYVVQSPEVDQSGFISMLQQKGYEVRQKDLRTRSDGSAKGDWDMGMAIDIMGLVDKLDVVSIVTGDGDFVSLLHLVKTIGPRVEVISFVHNTARDLVQSADLHIPIEETLLMRPDSNGSYNKQTPRAEAQPLDRSEKPEKIEKTEPI